MCDVLRMPRTDNLDALTITQTDTLHAEAQPVQRRKELGVAVKSIYSKNEAVIGVLFWIAILLAAGSLAPGFGIGTARAAGDFVTSEDDVLFFVPSREGQNPRTIALLLPTNVITSPSSIAVLQYQVSHTQVDHNEIYINPPTPVCGQADSDFNQAQSIGIIEDRDAARDMLDDRWSEYDLFRSDLLRAGLNTLAICSRNSSGGLTGGLDDFLIGFFALHFQVDGGDGDELSALQTVEEADDRVRYQELYDAWRTGLNLPAPEVLQHSVTNDPSPDVRALALRVLADHYQQATHAASLALGDPDWRIQHLAAEILERSEAGDLSGEQIDLLNTGELPQLDEIEAEDQIEE